ncbi:hypothetical protein, partial [Shewanella sp. TB7-MNA-CIBAN-0143]|uniref:hypothetical protein n=1 Tax=unclassified Shewanella TaxID=196818 RepID=UPI003327D3BE
NMTAVCRICPCVPFGDKRVGHFQAPDGFERVVTWRDNQVFLLLPFTDMQVFNNIYFSKQEANFFNQSHYC